MAACEESFPPPRFYQAQGRVLLRLRGIEVFSSTVFWQQSLESDEQPIRNEDKAPASFDGRWAKLL